MSAHKDSRLASDDDLIGTIVALASLASEVKKIDPILDTMRHITARRTPGEPLTNTDRVALSQLTADIENYLMHDDPLRTFRRQDLDSYIAAQRLGNKKSDVIGAWPITAICALIAAGTVALPHSAHADTWLLAIPVFLVGITIASAWYYISALRHFKPELRRAFRALCLGIVGLSVQFFHFALIAVLGQDTWPLYRFGGLPAIGLLAFFALFIGLRKYMRILQLHSRYSSMTSLAGSVIIIAATASGLAFAIEPTALWPYFGFSLTCVLGISVTALFCAVMARAIARSVTVVYAQSVKHLAVFSAAVSIGAFGFTIVMLIVHQVSGSVLSIALAICAMPALLLLLESGHSFKKETSLD